MRIEEAVSIAARHRLDLYRKRKTSVQAANDKELGSLRSALSALIAAAEEHRACRQRGVAIKANPMPRYKPCPLGCGGTVSRHRGYKHKCPSAGPRQVAPFMYECPGCKQHFGKGKGPYGLARHCCHPSHPQLRRAR